MRFIHQIFVLTVCFLVSITTIAAVNQSDCTRGSFFDGSECKLCPPGTYQWLSESTECEPCPKGTYFSFWGGQGKDVCRTCRNGTGHSITGASRSSQCKPCPPGSAIVSGVCSDCRSGYKLSLCAEEDKEFRDSCYFSDVTDDFSYPHSVSCRKCPSGMYSAPNSNQCSTCAADERVNSDKSGCDKCPPVGCFKCGDYKIYDSALAFPYFVDNFPISEKLRFTDESCKTCPAGFVGDKLLGSSRCIPCPVGTHRPDNAEGPCIPCAQGENISATGAHICVVDSSACPSEFFRNFRGSCVKCNKQQWYNAGKKECVPCGKFQFSEGGFSRRCQACPQGAIGTQNGCVCRVGWEPTSTGCKICKPGFVWEADYDFPKTLGICKRCKSGTITETPGLTDCTKCGSGTSTNSDQTRCIRRPVRFPRYCPRDMSVTTGCVVPATNCPPGKTRVDSDDFEFYFGDTVAPLLKECV